MGSLSVMAAMSFQLMFWLSFNQLSDTVSMLFPAVSISDVHSTVTAANSPSSSDASPEVFLAFFAVVILRLGPALLVLVLGLVLFFVFLGLILVTSVLFLPIVTNGRDLGIGVVRSLWSV